MSFWLATQEDQRRKDWLKRFDSRYWTVNFPRPMMASIVTTVPGSLRADFVFYQKGDLAGLIWESADTIDHPLLRYDTHRDYRGITLAFQWRSAGVAPLDAVYGPTLTIEGRDAEGAARTWYVRLWNYADGSGSDAEVRLSFDELSGGFLLPAEADPVWAGDIDRIFISVVAPQYDGTAVPLATPAEGWVQIEDIRCTGPGSTIKMGDAWLPEHVLRAASGYDDSYNITPERMLRNARALGYRKWLNHYIGMSHQFRLEWSAGEGRFVAVDGEQPFNAPFLAWHRDLLVRAKAAAITTILSISYEMFDAHAPQAWKQRKHDGSPALTGWSPPSTLLSPANTQAQAYLENCGRALAALALAADCPAELQIGEPWWWVGADRAPCIYDASALARYLADTGLTPPPPVSSADTVLTQAQAGYLDWAGRLLAQSTAAVLAAARTIAPALRTYLLFYAPQVLGTAADNLVRLNLPQGWARPAFDVFQLEDYDFVLAGDEGAQVRARTTLDQRLGYPLGEQQYFSGFVLRPEEVLAWRNIDAAAVSAVARGVPEVFIWALPQVIRDGFTHYPTGEDPVSFDDVRFPVALGFDATAEPYYSTQIVTMASGFEQRNSNWAHARRRYDAGAGVRSEADLSVLLGFFHARRGPAHAFRFEDPLDSSSSMANASPTATDQLLGTGDGQRVRFDLIKRYHAQGDARRITRPVPGSVRVAVAGAEQPVGWSLDALGSIIFDVPPGSGVAVTAGFRFDVPVRFGQDSLLVSLSAVRGGDTPSVPLIEVREA